MILVGHLVPRREGMEVRYSPLPFRVEGGAFQPVGEGGGVGVFGIPRLGMG